MVIRNPILRHNRCFLERWEIPDTPSLTIDGRPGKHYALRQRSRTYYFQTEREVTDNAGEVYRDNSKKCRRVEDEKELL